MWDLYASKSVIHQHSCIETPQRNEIIEQNHQRQLLNVARALSFQAHLPSQFWADCVLTARYLINRIPSPHLHGKSPYEILFSWIPIYSHLRVFRCLCYTSTLKCHRAKFDPQARACIILGYPFSVKNYKLYNINTKTVFVSKDVLFHETIFPFTSINDYVSTPFELVLPTPLADVLNPTSIPNNNDSNS